MRRSEPSGSAKGWNGSLTATKEIFQTPQSCALPISYYPDSNIMLGALETVKNLSRLTPAELGDRQKHPGTDGNKAAFLSVARGIMTEPEAARLQELIDDSCIES